MLFAAMLFAAMLFAACQWDAKTWEAKGGGGELLHCHLVAPFCPWRGGRVVEGAALEMLYRGNSIEGSNPSLSVLKPAPGPAF